MFFWGSDAIELPCVSEKKTGEYRDLGTLSTIATAVHVPSEVPLNTPGVDGCRDMPLPIAAPPSVWVHCDMHYSQMVSV